MSTENTNKNFYRKDGEEYCLCRKHQEFFPCSSFFVDRKRSNGHVSLCKPCYKEEQKARRLLKEPEPSKDVVELTMEVLERLGYDTKQNIHQQFLKKHNL
jgi:hypothetical protein